jgi:hypothetical protein
MPPCGHLFLFNKLLPEYEVADVQSEVPIVFRIAIVVAKQADVHKRQASHYAQFAHISVFGENIAITNGIVFFPYEWKDVSKEMEIAPYVESIVYLPDRDNAAGKVLVRSESFVKHQHTVWGGGEGGRL